MIPDLYYQGSLVVRVIAAVIFVYLAVARWRMNDREHTLLDVMMATVSVLLAASTVNGFALHNVEVGQVLYGAISAILLIWAIYRLLVYRCERNHQGKGCA